MRVQLTWLIILTTAFAGCADGSEAPSDDTFQDFDEDLEATATTGIIRGVVTDETITPVPDATITIKSLGVETTSDANGLFGFADLDPGAYFLEAKKVGFSRVQTSVTVEAGVEKPPIARFLLEFVPEELPYIEALSFHGHLTCGFAVFATSVGCTMYQPIADQLGDTSIFPHKFEARPSHVAAELVWRNTQALSGMFIWEITPGGNTHIGYRETTPSPALAYLDEEAISANEGGIMDDDGIRFRFFGGPHELCHGYYGFGCGVTLDQDADAYIHNFYNMFPTEGWRFTSDGDHPIPQ